MHSDQTFIRNTAKAMHDFHTAFELNAGIAQTFLQRSLILSFQGKYQQIIQEYHEKKKAGEVFDASLLVLVAKAKMRTGDVEGALEILSNSFEGSSEPQIHLNRGLCFQSLKRYAQACTEYDKCISSSPRFAKGFFNRGVCKLNLNLSEGIKDINEAIRLDAKLYEAYLTRAAYYGTHDKYMEGIEDCGTAIRLEPASIRGYLLRGQLRFKLKMYTSAVLDLSRASEIDRDCFGAFFNRGVTFHHYKDYPSAIRDYSISILLNDRDFTARKNRGLLYWQQGEYDCAVHDLETAIAAGCSDLEVCEVLGMALFKMGRADKAINVFTQMTSTFPESIVGYMARANILSQIGEYSSAMCVNILSGFNIFVEASTAGSN
jgi:tetratricopeptide (TPR) repeat protein